MIKPNLISLCERKLNKSKINCISLGNNISNNTENNIPISSITILELDEAIPVGSTYKLETTIKPLDATNKKLRWKSSDPSVAIVSSDGTVRGVGSGTCTITASATDGSGKSAKFSVNIAEYRTLAMPRSTIIQGFSFSSDNEYEWLWDSNLNRLISTNKELDYTTSITVIRISVTSQCTFSFNYGVFSELNQDKLTITLDDYPIVHVSGILSDYTYSRTLAAGNHSLVLKYSKDGSISKNGDFGYISNMKITAIPLYVDLGLPSGTKWATFNLGADSPEDYGKYYAWGETTALGEAPSAYPSSYAKTPNSTYTSQSTKTRYDWAHYKYMTNGRSSWNSCSKYTFADGHTTALWYSGGAFIGDNKTVLDLEDDAARVNWGGNWRMPTKEEQDELRENCYWKWVPSYNGKSRSGYIVYKVKNSADKGKITNSASSYSPVGSYSVSDPHIFLPITGYSDIGGNYFGSYGYYWSSSLSLNDSYSGYVLYLDYRSGKQVSESRCLGYTIRPVINI